MAADAAGRMVALAGGLARRLAAEAGAAAGGARVIERGGNAVFAPAGRRGAAI